MKTMVERDNQLEGGPAWPQSSCVVIQSENKGWLSWPLECPARLLWAFLCRSISPAPISWHTLTLELTNAGLVTVIQRPSVKHIHTGRVGTGEGSHAPQGSDTTKYSSPGWPRPHYNSWP